jgi:hypothetical protein
MILLEFASRLCNDDTLALADFSEALKTIDSRYFTVLPGPCGRNKDFELPSVGPNRESQLLWCMFDLIRNGQAHQYQQILVKLSGGDFFINLTGADWGRVLSAPGAQARTAEHLTFRRNGADLELRVRTDWLFLDIKSAIKNSKLLTRTTSFNYLRRSYQFSCDALETALSEAGHQRY